MVPIDKWPPRQSSGPTIEDLVEESASSGRGRGGDATREEKEEQVAGLQEGMDLGGFGSAGDEYLMQLLWPGCVVRFDVEEKKDVTRRD